MRVIEGFINVYKSGFWHQEGKAGAFDRHGGDIYPNQAAAFNAIEQPHLHVATVPIYWHDSSKLRAWPDPHMMDAAIKSCLADKREVCWLDAR